MIGTYGTIRNTMYSIQNKNHPLFKITNNWDLLSKLLTVQFSELTKEDLALEAGKENELISRIAARLKIPQEAVIDIIQENFPENI